VSGLGDEAVELARDLIRIDTSNPPGGETPAAELLAERLAAAGAECELVGPDPERLNLVARVSGTGDAPSLLLMAHTDVVPAPAEGWSVPPFDGAVRDGMIVGRGAGDMKGELAARAAALAAIARRGEPPPGDVVLVAESDEERNTEDVGMSWLVRERPELVRTDCALNEGGGIRLPLAGGREVVTVSVGEKKVCSLRIRFRAAGGHASVPLDAESPLPLAAEAVRRLAGHRAEPRMDEALERSLAALGAPRDPDGAVEWGRAQHPILPGLLSAMTRLTVTPTGLEAGEPPNVVPGAADVVCDCRALPGQGLDDVTGHVEAALAGLGDYEVEMLEPLEGGTESPVGTPLFAAIEEFVAERLPGAVVVPVVSPGFSDSYFVRRDLGTAAYGFAPVFAMDPGLYLAGAHAADESLAIEDLVTMAEFHLFAADSLGGRL
jgi:acetylornithine deacetylase/succinyl-diaminopimelate desuccinylase-like protein